MIDNIIIVTATAAAQATERHATEGYYFRH